MNALGPAVPLPSMKTTSIFTPCVVSAVALSLSVALLSTGCVSTRYRMAKDGTPPPELLKVPLAAAPLGVELTTLITYGGPGSWKREAFWDEYVVTLHNPGREPVVISDASLVDFAGSALPAGDNPWALEKTSKTLERKYHDAGLAFVRYTAPGVIIVGVGAIVMASGGGVFSAAFATGAAATVVALPVYYLAVILINHSNKEAVEVEFTRRRLGLPLTLAPGETRTGSFFFPMVPNPRSLNLHWSSGPAGGGNSLSLDFLHGLHVKAPDTAKTR